MQNIRCMVADIPQMVLADIIQKIVEERPGVEIVGRVDNDNDLNRYLDEHAIDVVIHCMEETSNSALIDNILKNSPQAVSVGLQKSGRLVCVCVDDIGPEQLLNLIENVTRIRKQHSLSASALSQGK